MPKPSNGASSAEGLKVEMEVCMRPCARAPPQRTEHSHGTPRDLAASMFFALLFTTSLSTCGQTLPKIPSCVLIDAHKRTSPLGVKLTLQLWFEDVSFATYVILKTISHPPGLQCLAIGASLLVKTSEKLMTLPL